MSKLSKQHCFNHANREAIACCLECNRYFCRECITEHNGRFVCSGCLQNISDGEKSKSNSFLVIPQLIYALLAFLLLWIIFYSIGDKLQSIPTKFYKGALWEEK